MICKICFADFESTGIRLFLEMNPIVCEKCFQKMNPQFFHGKILGYPITSIYAYNAFIRELIYRYKGGKDYELKEVFLAPYKKLLKFFYRDYVLVPVPSHIEADKQRGFNHVQEVFCNLKIPIIIAVKKTSLSKQSSRRFFARKQIKNELMPMDNLAELKGKKVLIVDDVLTTGFTLKAMIKIVEQANPRKIKVLTIARRIGFPTED
ncbi:MAG TPA: phosphoribosyltransferase family protein [Bacilli bacterium]|nr:phosphoribosyltransferase family protein [Bacilli bacterium]